MSQLSYEVFSVPDQEENTCTLAEQMVEMRNPKNLIKDANAAHVIDAYDLSDIKDMLANALSL